MKYLYNGKFHTKIGHYCIYLRYLFLFNTTNTQKEKCRPQIPQNSTKFLITKCLEVKFLHYNNLLLMSQLENHFEIWRFRFGNSE